MFKLLIFVVISIEYTMGAKILCYYPTPSISHQIVFRRITQELARRGHELVVITTDPYLPKDRPKDNVTEIDVHHSYTNFQKRMGEMVASSDTVTESIHNYVTLGLLEAFDEQMMNPEVQKIMKGPNDFDLLIVEAIVRPVFFITHKFKIPVLGVNSVSGTPYNFDVTGDLVDPILYSHFSSISEKISTIISYLYHRYAYWRTAEQENRVGKKHFGEDTPDIQELIYNMDLLFLNINPIWEGVRPSTPAIVYIGGLHVHPPQELPQDLQQYLDSCTQGVVYMSLGTNVKCADLPEEKLRVFQKSFSQLPHCVIWKCEIVTMRGNSDNVRLFRWLPQTDLLAHPNILLFITQCGQQSTDEAIDREVPVIGIPIIADQFMNAERYVHHGIGKYLDINTITVEILTEAVSDVVSNDSYRNNVRRLKALMYDQPMSSIDRAMWWAEYLLRHGTGKHLRARPLALDVSLLLLVPAAALVAVALAGALVCVCTHTRKHKID